MTEPKSVVLPLHHRAMKKKILVNGFDFENTTLRTSGKLNEIRQFRLILRLNSPVFGLVCRLLDDVKSELF